MRLAALLPLALAMACTAGLAQTPPPARDLQRDPAPDPRTTQKIERIRIEDAGSRVDELRVGGQTQSITVQPKADVPAYEIAPSDLARTRPADRREGFSGGSQRVWNVLSF